MIYFKIYIVSSSATYVIIFCHYCRLRKSVLQEEFEDTKGVIKTRKSKKGRQHNEEKKRYKRTNNDLKNTTQKTKDPHQKPGMNSGAPEG